VFLVAIVAVVLVGWFWWESRQWEDTDDAEIDGHIYPISARINGHVIKVNFNDGDFVKQGDVLVVVDPTDYQVALERARADYADAEAQAKAAQYGVPVSSVGSGAQIRSAAADMDAAQAGVAGGVADAVADGVIAPEAAEDLLLIAAVWISPAAREAALVYRNTRAATRAALQAAQAGTPTVADMLAARHAPANPFFTLTTFTTSATPATPDAPA